jgi:hypothetical protein
VTQPNPMSLRGMESTKTALNGSYFIPVSTRKCLLWSIVCFDCKRTTTPPPQHANEKLSTIMADMKMAMTPVSSSAGTGGMAMPSTGGEVDLHELAKGWKAAIARAKDPATR